MLPDEISYRAGIAAITAATAAAASIATPQAIPPASTNANLAGNIAGRRPPVNGWLKLPSRPLTPAPPPPTLRPPGALAADSAVFHGTYDAFGNERA